MLRSFDESLALREHASAARRAVVIGAGFIGCEVAASLRSLGVDVVLVEPQPHAAGVGARRADRRAGGAAASRRGRRRPPAASGSPRCAAPAMSRSVVLADGTELPADLVVVGIGSRPCDRLAGRQRHRGRQRRGLRRGRPHQRAERVGARRRRVLARYDGTPSARGTLEQRRRAGPGRGARDAGPGRAGRRRGARTSGATSTTSRSSAWGSRTADDIVHIVEDDGRKFLAYYERDGAVVGVVGGGMPGKVMKARGKIAAAPDRRRPSARVLSLAARPRNSGPR